MADHLLDLTTLIEKPIISIDGTKYEILHPDQLGIIDAHKLQSMAERIAAITKTPELNTDGVHEISDMIIDLSDRIMVGVPADVRTKLTEAQRIAVAEVFMKIPGAKNWRPRKTAKPKTKARRSAGSKPRSDASGSMAGARSDG